MLWITRLSAFFSAAMAVIVLSPSLQSFPPAAAIRSSDRSLISSFRNSPPFRNAAEECLSSSAADSNVCNPSLVHVAITLDVTYLRGSIAAVNSILQHSLCPESVFFHFIVSSETNLESLVRSTFQELKFKVYYFAPETVRGLISSSVRQALEQPLNYARNYLAELLEGCVNRVIYLDSDLVVVDDIAKLWKTGLGPRVIGAPEVFYIYQFVYFIYINTLQLFS